jgi:hypothetical protein
MAHNKAFHVIDHGRVKATIWHEKKRGKIRFNVAFTRIPRPDERWWDTTNFQQDDMLAIARLAEDVHMWIGQHAQFTPEPEAEEEGSIEGTS